MTLPVEAALAAASAAAREGVALAAAGACTIKRHCLGRLAAQLPGHRAGRRGEGEREYM